MMDLETTILREHSKSTCSKIVRWIGGDQQRFDQLFRLFVGDDDLLVQRAGWPLSYAVAAHPAFIKKHFPKLLKNLERKKVPDAVKRNTVRLLQNLVIPEKFHGEIMNRCFGYLLSPLEKPAVKAFSLTILENLSGQYPEIKQELRTIIDERWDLESSAFRSRAKRVLKSIR